MSQSISSFLDGNLYRCNNVCDKHGEYESIKIFDVWSICPICSTQSKKPSLEYSNSEEKRKIASFNHALRLANIPARYHESSFDLYQCSTKEQISILEVIKKYSNEFDVNNISKRSLIFLGNAGTGKTHLACSLAIQMIHQHKRPFYTTLQKIMRRVKESWNKNSSFSESQVLDELCAYDLLIVDEIGIQNASNFEHNVIFDIIDTRYANLKPTILISNLLISEIEKIIGSRSLDRIRENNGKILSFSWNSFRRQSIN